MTRAVRLLLVAASAAAIALAATPAIAATTQVVARNYEFAATAACDGTGGRSVIVDVNDVVEWRNCSESRHTLTSDDGHFDHSLSPGGTVSITFRTPGSYDYHCALHPGLMSGTVVVRSGQAATPTTRVSGPTTTTAGAGPTTTTAAPATAVTTTTSRPAATSTTSPTTAAPSPTTTAAPEETTTTDAPAPSTTAVDDDERALAATEDDGGGAGAALLVGAIAFTLGALAVVLARVWRDRRGHVG